MNVEVESARSSNPQVRLLLTLVFVLSLTAVLLVWNKDELLLRRDMLSPFSTSSKQLRFCSYSIQNMTSKHVRQEERKRVKFPCFARKII